MTKRTHQQSTETTPARSSSPAPDLAPTAVRAPSTADASSLSSDDFWWQLGMDYFISWLTDSHNYKTLDQKKKLIAGETTNEMLYELRAHVKDYSGLDWTREQVKGKVQYAMKKYIEANEIRKTVDDGNISAALSRRIMVECPHFERFHAVFSSSLANNPPPLYRPAKHLGDRTVDRESEEKRFSSIEDEPIIEPSKRQKTTCSKYSTLDDHIRTMRSSSGSSMDLEKERMKQIARREQVLEERENSWVARWFERERQLEEKLKRRADEQEAELKKRIQEVEARLKQQWDELENAKVDLRLMQKDLQGAQKDFQDAQKDFFAQHIRK